MSPEASLTPIAPFGLEVRYPAGTLWGALEPEQLHEWLSVHKVLVLRGVTPMGKLELPQAARALGPLQAWSFGSVNELKPTEDTKNYLYTRRAVPLHWDGAFAGRAPRYLFFQCVEAPPEDAGGETTFVDTTRIWAEADEATRDLWRQLRFVYQTERVVHYGGSFTARLVDVHPHTGEPVLRFAEPVEDLNPVSVTIEGLDPIQSAQIVGELRRRLYQPDKMLAHRWQPGDIVIADNYALLHGRRPFLTEARRHIQRVNLHGPEEPWYAPLANSLRIRRPEFMVAEIPILLIPALLVTRSASELWSGVFGWLLVLFFLLFHFGDMSNCLADRRLDAVYKTHLSEAVYGLGVKNVRWQILLTVALSLWLGGWLSWRLQRWEILGLVGFGLLFGAQYSYGPLKFKGRGLWQILCLWAIIFVGPMLLVYRVLSEVFSPELIALVGCYGVMQQGIILVNTAEDLTEDQEAGLYTSAIALGLPRSLWVSFAMVLAGGLGVLSILGWWLYLGDGGVLSLLPLLLSWCWVLLSLRGAGRAIQGRETKEALKRLRPRARWVPVWITATALGTLLAAAFSPSFTG